MGEKKQSARNRVGKKKKNYMTPPSRKGGNGFSAGSSSTTEEKREGGGAAIAVVRGEEGIFHGKGGDALFLRRGAAPFTWGIGKKRKAPAGRERGCHVRKGKATRILREGSPDYLGWGKG